MKDPTSVSRAKRMIKTLHKNLNRIEMRIKELEEKKRILEENIESLKIYVEEMNFLAEREKKKNL